MVTLTQLVEVSPVAIDIIDGTCLEVLKVTFTNEETKEHFTYQRVVVWSRTSKTFMSKISKPRPFFEKKRTQEVVDPSKLWSRKICI